MAATRRRWLSGPRQGQLGTRCSETPRPWRRRSATWAAILSPFSHALPVTPRNWTTRQPARSAELAWGATQGDTGRHGGSGTCKQVVRGSSPLASSVMAWCTTKFSHHPFLFATLFSNTGGRGAKQGPTCANVHRCLLGVHVECLIHGFQSHVDRTKPQPLTAVEGAGARDRCCSCSGARRVDADDGSPCGGHSPIATPHADGRAGRPAERPAPTDTTLVSFPPWL